MKTYKIRLVFKFNEKEPHPRTKMRDVLFSFTRLIAEFLDGFNYRKLQKIQYRREFIRDMQRDDFIESEAQRLYKIIPKEYKDNMAFASWVCYSRAEQIFQEKEDEGCFDSLYQLIKEDKDERLDKKLN